MRTSPRTFATPSDGPRLLRDIHLNETRVSIVPPVEGLMVFAVACSQATTAGDFHVGARKEADVWIAVYVKAGDADSPINWAPPADLSGNTSTEEPGVGAHALHLSTSQWRATVDCDTCHTVARVAKTAIPRSSASRSQSSVPPSTSTETLTLGQASAPTRLASVQFWGQITQSRNTTTMAQIGWAH